MTPPIKTTHGCEKFFWDMCFGIIGPANKPRPYPKTDMVMGGCADKAGETYDVEKSKKKQKPQMASDALRNYCDPHPHLSECNDDSQCVRKEERKYICEKEAQNDKCKELDFPGEWTCGCRIARNSFLSGC